jgi:hypothetical protein
MASEILFEAFMKYIEPLLEFGWVHITDKGFLAEREYGSYIYYINDKYKGLPGEYPRIYPVVPLSDEHYLEIKENPEQEVFNPFRSFKYMQLVMMEFKRGLVTNCVSDEAGKTRSLEEMEDLIRFHYEKVNGVFKTGFVNAEDEENLKLLYSYEGLDLISSIWGLCVTAYNDADRRHADYFYEIEKSWVKARRLAEKWENERRKIMPKIKAFQQGASSLQQIDFTENGQHKINDYGPSHYVGQENMDMFLLSLFNIHELADGVMSQKEEEDLISRKERVWVFPDFAYEKEILAKEREKETIFKKESAIDVTPSSQAPIETEYEDTKLIEDSKAPPLAMEEKPEASNGALSQTPMPPIGGLYGNDPFIGFGARPFGGMMPMGNYGSPPMGMGAGPLMPMPGWGMAGPQFAGMGFGNGAMPGYGVQNNAPEDISQIDFESKDHPDPFSHYR